MGKARPPLTLRVVTTWGAKPLSPSPNTPLHTQVFTSSAPHPLTPQLRN